jgi:hypothetical protein
MMGGGSRTVLLTGQETKRSAKQPGLANQNNQGISA